MLTAIVCLTATVVLVAAAAWHDYRRPIMAKPNQKRFKREELHAQASDKLGVDPGYQLDCGDDDPVWVPHPLFVSDEANQAMQELEQNNASPGADEQARLILGEDEYQRMLKSGWEAGDVMLCWMMMNNDMRDTVPGAGGGPTQSAT